MDRHARRPSFLLTLLLSAVLLPLVGCGHAREETVDVSSDAGEAAVEEVFDEVVEEDEEPELPPPGPEDLFRVEASRELRPAEARLVDALRARAPSAESGRMDVVTVADDPVLLPAEGRLDLQWGSGHGSRLVFTRFELGPDEIRVEQVGFQGRTMRREDPPVATVRRVTVPREVLEPALDLVGALASLRVERKARPGPWGGSSWGSTSDFYVLARCHDGGGRPVLDQHFVGYAGQRNEARYGGLRHVRDAAQEALDAIPSWQDVPIAEHRTCHLTAAFADNREVMVGDFAWWVQERSLEWLALAGTRDAIPTLEWLREHDPDPHRRRTKKIEALLADPARWLEGPPQDLQSVE